MEHDRDGVTDLARTHGMTQLLLIEKIRYESFAFLQIMWIKLRMSSFSLIILCYYFARRHTLDVSLPSFKTHNMVQMY